MVVTGSEWKGRGKGREKENGEEEEFRSGLGFEFEHGNESRDLLIYTNTREQLGPASICVCYSTSVLPRVVSSTTKLY